ncbi:hypothetical protein E2C01_097718 [Portunus trituberculatus]|uniref:Uncharacterized protein n=1 Tax=Portunus trituberculatus TaxID=210409 RepID=A0A5B7KAB6_PORTR|nr:hypothetical protein [Portunus trituberculatus]
MNKGLSNNTPRSAQRTFFSPRGERESEMPVTETLTSPFMVVEVALVPDVLYPRGATPTHPPPVPPVPQCVPASVYQAWVLAWTSEY